MLRTILVVDDEKDIVEMLRYNLEKDGFNVLTAYNGNDALELARQLPDLITLDIMMPDRDGWEVARQLKREKETSSIPIVFITAKNSEIDEIVGLELGAADYIKKPVSVGSIVARIRSILRNRESMRMDSLRSDRVLKFDALQINIPNYSVKIGNDEVNFTKKEFELLAYMAEHFGNVLTREDLLREVWGGDAAIYERTIDVHIRKIREKLGAYARCITTVKRVGYRFVLLQG